MNRLNVEYLLGHTIGLNSNYYRPTEQELLIDYLKSVPSLTINETNVRNLKIARRTRTQIQRQGERD